MKKMQDKSKIYTIHAKAPTPPQTKPYGWQTPIFPRKSINQEESMGLVKMPANCLSVSVTPHVSKPHDYVNHMFMRP
jgi:hypothetical protein